MAAPVKRSYTVSEHQDRFIARQVENGRFANSSEVVRAALRLLEDRETKLAELRALIDEADASVAAGRVTTYANSQKLIDKIIQRSEERLAREGSNTPTTPRRT